ncbi:hydroxyisourate hydrolase [Metabacillus sediminilitoris]|uniref:5-hydroxyisourate hydrolase n=1 Tax=Metabacillus sediminilitoris TaxID=2567941 RepID=A0A4S4C3P7_9BACI|nr:hydroxyisourate hydrolase [Metabacillus sediminilitoris]QGQ45407.1 hydroxyisourate hydrolase [Metabacillus sediminilitoris]THF82295.1 hydroxyisourate hydrolase [Metabacillus sediminilitoris]
MSGLTTHVLDLSHGQPASHMKVKLYYSEAQEWQLIKTVVTNSDGRLNEPLLSENEVKIGTYELVFHVGDYFRSKNIELQNPAFLEQVPVRFGIANLKHHYHVPLLISPWGYQVYRGS